MEKDFIKIFNGLERNYGYIKDIGSSKHNNEGKLKTVYTWAKKEITDQDLMDFIKENEVLVNENHNLEKCILLM